MGYRFAKVLASCGAEVAISARRVDKLESLASEIKEDDGKCIVVPIDMVDRVLKPKGVAIVIDAAHQCMSSRGVHKTETSTVTSRMLGAFRENPKSRMEFMNLIAL